MKRKTKGRKGVCTIKLDMSKAYDRVEWAFLAKIMVRIGFDQQWIDSSKSFKGEIAWNVAIFWGSLF